MSFGLGFLGVWLPGKVGKMTENIDVNVLFWIFDMEETKLTNPKCCARLSSVEFIIPQVPYVEISDIRVIISYVLVRFLGNQTER